MPKNQKKAGTAIAASSRLITHVKGYNSVLQKPSTLFVEVGDLVWAMNGMGDVAARMGSAVGFSEKLVEIITHSY